MTLSYEALCEALEGRRLPVALVDLDALDRNLDRMANVVQVPIRVATKSIRVSALIRRVLTRGKGRYRGLMCYAVAEAAFLARAGFDDLLIAYPAFRRVDLALLAEVTREGKNISIAVDCEAAVDRIAEVARSHGVTIRVVLCADMSLRLGNLHLGVRRSPVHSVEDAVRLARTIASREGLRLHGLLGYEAQVAGLGDDSPFDPRSVRVVKGWVRGASIVEVRRRRSAIVRALERDGLPLEVVNGGGTGSLDSSTSASGVTEATAGSGFFKSHLFDYYSSRYMRALEPAAFFALEITRRPAPDIVTCLGGGYVASGAVGRDKVPLPFLPRGLSLLGAELAGEVQTPLRVPPGVALQLGDPVVFRHAKSGELAERFSSVLLLQGGRVVDEVPTYRGEGQCYL